MKKNSNIFKHMNKKQFTFYIIFGGYMPRVVLKKEKNVLVFFDLMDKGRVGG